MITLSRKTKKRIIDSLSILTFVGWAGFLYLRFYYFYSVASGTYAPETGHIYEVNCHGCVFYLDKTQNLQTFIPLVIGALLFIAFLLLERRWRIYKDIVGNSDKLIKYNSYPQ